MIRANGGLMDQRDEDWRDTMFYWQGKLSWVGGERNVMTWRGTWLSSVANVLPDANDFNHSFNFFELSFDVDAERAAHLSRGRTDLELLLGLCADFRGHYLMEPPDGTGYRRAYRDDAHSFLFDARCDDAPALVAAAARSTPFGCYAPPSASSHQISGPTALCASRGCNEFGNFIALGHAQKLRGTGAEDAVELTLARRYVRDDDSRWRWPLRDLLGHVAPANARVSPWENALPCRLPADVIAADARRDAEVTASAAFAQPMHDSHDGAALNTYGHGGVYDHEMIRKRRRP
ncbi:hypothetical protein M885DRAFT_513174 [Pelagophyceae sp. CCMP2097]|nr:hypothetical protein M885DRAFT_513174 [Pelagophyceae sp. CCMP2097]